MGKLKNILRFRCICGHVSLVHGDGRRVRCVCGAQKYVKSKGKVWTPFVTVKGKRAGEPFASWFIYRGWKQKGGING